MSDQPAKHGHQHLPDGPDPIPFPTLASAIADGSKSMTLTGSDLVQFSEMYATPGYYEPDTGDVSNFNFVNLLQDGFYQADFVVSWNSVFSGTEDPYIEPACQIGGTPDTLVNSVEVNWNNTANWIGGEQLDSGEYAHFELYARVFFNHREAYDGSDFGIGVRLKSSSGATKTIFGAVAVTRLSDALVEVT